MRTERDVGVNDANNSGAADGDTLTTYCATHPKVETRLRCGKCGRPICPKCLVFTPVGARCRTCANLKPLPVFQVKPVHYAEALAAAIAVGLIGGVIWTFVASAIPFLSFWLVLGVGYLAGEAISLSANRKRSTGLQVIAGLTVLLAYVIRGLFPMLVQFPLMVLSGWAILDLALRQVTALFTSPLSLLVFALAIYIAVKRV